MRPHLPRTRYQHVARVALLALALANSGCLVAAAGVAGGAAVGYAYFKGKLCETYNANCDDTWAATRTALGELAMPIVAEEHTGSEGFIESRTADDEQVRISVQSATSEIPAQGPITRVCVRVATFGDRPLSDLILDQVGLHLAPVLLPGAPATPAASTSGVIQTGTSPASSPPANFRRETAPPALLPAEPVPTQKNNPM